MIKMVVFQTWAPIDDKATQCKKNKILSKAVIKLSVMMSSLMSLLSLNTLHTYILIQRLYINMFVSIESNKSEHRKKMMDQLLGKEFEAKGMIINSAFHEMETLLYVEIVAKRKFSRRLSNTFIRLCVIQLIERLKR